ncbi:MAG: phytanoyl-CoA dioxygenase family protein [Undibacterium sp.]|nr:phytanoyl-CoA dioxygenase family protein [Undibacterium sp.]
MGDFIDRKQTMLNQEQIAQFQQDGYLVIADFKSAAEIAAVRAQAARIVDDFDAAESNSIFTTKEQEKKIDRYFLDSASKVSCFFEEEAFDEHGQLRQAKALSINKIGHALHDLDPVFAAFSHGPQLAQVAHDLGLAQPQIWQSMYIFKQPGIGGEVRWHQDATYFDTAPVSVTTFWFALEDATLDNGCLWVEPGGHRTAMRERFVREGDQVRVDTLDSTPWPGDATAIPLEAKAGSLVCFHGLLPHYSAPNRSAISRHAYTLHVTDGQTRYSAQNWIQRDASFPVRGFI